MQNGVIGHGQNISEFYRRRYHVLIVDDDEDLREMIAIQFALDDRFCISTARNGKEAADYIEREVPDLIITDLQMPILNGWGLLLKIESMDGFKPEVILISGSGGRNFTKYGSDDRAVYIKKPFKPELLVQTACDLLGLVKELVKENEVGRVRN